MQPRLQADERDCQEKGAPPVAKSLGGTRKELENVGESGSVATSKVSAGPLQGQRWSPSAGRGRGRSAPASLGVAEQGS